MLRLPLLFLSSLALLSFALPARSAITVVGGGLAQACSQAVKRGEADRAVIDICTTALETEPIRRRDRAGTYVNRGIVHLRLSNFDLALSDFERAERLHPAIGEIFVNRGAALINQNQYADALAQIDRGIALGVEEPEKAYYNRGIAKERLDDTKGAYYDFRKAAELDPTWTLPQTQLARFTVTRRGS